MRGQRYYRALASSYENEELFDQRRWEEQELLDEAREAGDLETAEELLDE